MPFHRERFCFISRMLGFLILIIFLFEWDWTKNGEFGLAKNDTMLEQKFVDEVLYLFRNLKKINGFLVSKITKMEWTGKIWWTEGGNCVM